MYILYYKVSNSLKHYYRVKMVYKTSTYKKTLFVREFSAWIDVMNIADAYNAKLVCTGICE